MLEVHYVPSLVIASIAVAIMASFTSLRLTSGLAALGVHQRKVRISIAAFALGGGIWSMHFIGMLAVNLPIQIGYDPLRTLGSALIAILATGSALLFLHFGVRTRTRIVLAGVLTGLDWAKTNAPECQWVASFACDAPFAPRDLVSRFLAAIDTDGADLACASSGGRSRA